ncbi:putative trehalose synthase [Kineococcus xinjiangensis]|uniref:Maltokinase n=1 Tax=Kineococcus xinjiangensis TaxID=512762 RepID=A0A2S6IWA3_9ACTN|nr:phosphotransferase [Kineococcus xinjiangensis]PPK98637.1 putative trehalose synthase [Kineococcus xinjiangensis]
MTEQTSTSAIESTPSVVHAEGGSGRVGSGEVAGPGADALSGLLTGWLPRQRWFAHKGSAVSVTGIEVLPLPGPGSARVLLAFVTTSSGGAGESGPQVATYQVPLTVHPSPATGLESALVGEVASGDVTGWVYDGAHDAAFVHALLGLIADGGTAGAPEGTAVHGVRPAKGLPIPSDARSRVLRGEQSNTSIIVEADGATPLIAKVFRVLQAGDNPDVVVQGALADAGCTRVPAPAGWLAGGWSDAAAPGGRATGHLAFVTEFLAGSEDAWRVACAAVDADRDFTADARELGRATAEVHALLAAVLPTAHATAERLGALADDLAARVAWATSEVSELRRFGPGAREVADSVRAVRDAPDLQRVHGDYHLGQVLHTPGRGWVLLDFEGEPLRPLAERSGPEMALRDVAGMLRSFDYAGRHSAVGHDDPDLHARALAWTDASREAFLDGYSDVTGTDPRDIGTPSALLLRALELDKALYEVVYEARNRPDWLPIPLSAVERLLA